MDEDVRLCVAWGLGPAIAAHRPANGYVHRTWLVQTVEGHYALRGYRYDDRGRIEREHALIAYVREHDIPAIAPIPLPTGDTILERTGRYYSLFPRTTGEQVARDALDERDAAAMGECLARIHLALSEYPTERAAPRSLGVSRVDALARIERILAAIVSRPAPSADDEHCRRRLEGQRAALLRALDAPPDLTPLRSQVIHGDYQEANLFFDGGRVSAVIDWDQAYIAPRAWEVVRTLDLALRLRPDCCRAFLTAYRGSAELDSADVERAADWYGWHRLHDVWIYDSLYLEHNAPVRRLVPHGEFVPFAERWASVSL